MSQVDEVPLAAGAVRRVVTVSLLAGATMGVFVASYQVAVEPAQVLAGLVEYPPGNPFHLYELRLWTIWHQLLAPLLAAGVSERALSIGVSGLLGALAFVALALLTLFHGARPALAVATPFVMVLFDPVVWGFRYPIFLIGRGHTYGMAGLTWIVLVAALFGGGYFRLAAFLLGLAPALHASLGSMFCIVALLAVPFGPRALRSRSVVAAAAAGFSISLASFAAQRLLFPIQVEIDPAVAARYFDAFVQLWDTHRQPTSLADWNILLVWCALLFAIALLRFGRDQLPGSSAVSLRLYCLCGVIGFAANLFLVCIGVDVLPPSVAIAMPSRLLNFPTLAFLPIAIGLADRWRDGLFARLFLLTIGVFALFWQQIGPPHSHAYLVLAVLPLCVVVQRINRGAALRFVGFGLLVYVALGSNAVAAIFGLQGPTALAAGAAGLAAAIYAWTSLEPGLLRALQRRSATVEARAPSDTGRRRATATWLDRAIVTAFSLAVLLAVATAAREFPKRMVGMIDLKPLLVAAATSTDEGLIVPGPGVARVQLRSRHAVLLDPTALDMLAYAIEAGPAFASSLLEVYGIDFFDPPPEARQLAVVPEQPVSDIWAKRSLREWSALRARFGISWVLVKRGWTLHLPEAARSDRFQLYHIPK